ncbi:MAG: type IV secretory system conjugative DNA transfer family protein [Leptotrichiaceae bacterium]|nr:type IV secretory system conjugative DNA transfer family protein [Leptotrichiaceae bacterium]
MDLKTILKKLDYLYIKILVYQKEILVICLIGICFFLKSLCKELYFINSVNNKNTKIQFVYEKSYKNAFIFEKTDKKKVYLNKKTEELLKKKYPKLTKEIEEGEIYYVLICFLPMMLLTDLRRITHGSARFATMKDLVPTEKNSTEINLLEKEGVILGKFKGKFLVDNSNTHTLILAPTGAGKGVGIVMPTLVQTWSKGSAVVADLKGENYEFTADERRKRFDNKCFVLDFSDFNSCRYNPLSIIKKGSKDEVNNAKMVAEIIIKASSGDSSSKDPFWDNTAIAILSGVILYCLYSEKKGEINMGHIIKFIYQDKMLENVQKLKNTFTISENEVLQIAEYYEEDIDLLKQRKHPFIDRGFNTILSKTDKMLDSILTTIQTAIAVFEITTVKKVTSTSDFKLTDFTMYKTPITLFLRVTPQDVTIMQPLLNILITQLTQQLLPKKDRENKVYENINRVLFLIDEFPAFGKIKQLEDTLTYVRSYKLKYMLIAQEAKQIYKIYGKLTSFIGNCKTKVFFNITDYDEAENISKLCGKQTIRNKRSAFLSKNQQDGYMARELLTPDEVLTFKDKRSIIHVGGKPVIKGDKFFYFMNKKFRKKMRKVKTSQDKL